MIIDDLVHKNYNQLNENDLYIWQYISHHREECQKISIQELSKRCNISHTSIIRFAKKLGLEGYSELKIYLKWGLEQKDTFDSQTLHRVTKEYINTLHMMETTDFDELLCCIHDAKRVFVYSTGEVQYHAALELKREFAYRNRIMHVIEGTTELDAVLNHVQEEDLFIIISLSGDNEEAITLARFLGKMNIETIGISIDNQNLLSKSCSFNIQFDPSSFDLGYKGRYYTSTGHFFVIVNMLFLKYLEYCDAIENK